MELIEIIQFLIRLVTTDKDDVIIIQGDHRQTLLKEIEPQGYTVKLAGG
jgi:translation initiation factor 1 (eIF-1/SUI1)